MTKLVKLKSKRAVKKPAPSCAGRGCSTCRSGPPVGATGRRRRGRGAAAAGRGRGGRAARQGRGGVAAGGAVEGRLLGRVRIGHGFPLGRRRQRITGVPMLGRGRRRGPGQRVHAGVFVQVSGVRPRSRGVSRRACDGVGLDAGPAEGHIRRVRIASSRSGGRGRSRRGQSGLFETGWAPRSDELRPLTRLDTPALCG